MPSTLDPRPSTSSRGRLRENSQCAIILRALQAAEGDWISMPTLVAISHSYNIHSRIDELRQVHGYNIENDTDLSVRPHVSRYRLLTNPEPAIP